MIELPYSLVIEATSEPDYFGFYSEELEGFTGVGHSVEDCLYRAKWGMCEHIEVLLHPAILKTQGNSSIHHEGGKQARLVLDVLESMQHGVVEMLDIRRT